MPCHVPPGCGQTQRNQNARDLSLSLGGAGTQGLNNLLHIFLPCANDKCKPAMTAFPDFDLQFGPCGCSGGATGSVASLIARTTALLFDLSALCLVLKAAQT